MLVGDAALSKGVAALFDPASGKLRPEEGQIHDFKLAIRVDHAPSLGELARDVLGFSNSEGGLLIIGVADDRTVVGHEAVDFRRLRDGVGGFIGTRVDYDLERVEVSLNGRIQRLIVAVVRRSQTAYPNLLRRDVVLEPGHVRRVKYVSGTLFYRRGSQTVAESPYGDIESLARELGFSEAAPRARTSFVLQEDRPGLRLYAPINDRFFGRGTEVAELISKFDDPRGRGVSIAGFGGMGKTELGIRLASELHRRGKFQTIYSASAKQTSLGPHGMQQSDPFFIDHVSFLNDLAGWLGLSPSRMAPDELASLCLRELARLKKVLLFVDNLETVTDANLLAFLDSQLPSNCWVIATARIHKIRNYVYQKELREMDADDAARLLRHELKRQGLDSLASTPIEEIRAKAKYMFCHPLALRWFAWECRRNGSAWASGVGRTEIRDLESFCVAHTLGNLDVDTQRVLGAILAIGGVADGTEECIQSTSGLPESAVAQCLWELECSGMIYAATGENGRTTFSVAPLAQNPAAELSLKYRWEGDFVHNLSAYQRSHSEVPPDSPLLRQLVALEPRKVQDYTTEQKDGLIARIDRALPRCPEKFRLKLKWLKAECLRHLESLVSADGLYEECAETILAQGPPRSEDRENARLLLEAATVAKARSQTETHLRRAASYLEAIQDFDVGTPRVLGMLTEIYALLGDAASYAKFRERALSYHQANKELPALLLDPLDDALERARAHMQRRRT
ncbi:MAG: RNA-binding domain-containing protein [Candidatus Acidiferrales bacterium]